MDEVADLRGAVVGAKVHRMAGCGRRRAGDVERIGGGRSGQGQHGGGDEAGRALSFGLFSSGKVELDASGPVTTPESDLFVCEL